jgi:hypothetical protein
MAHTFNLAILLGHPIQDKRKMRSPHKAFFTDFVIKDQKSIQLTLLNLLSTMTTPNLTDLTPSTSIWLTNCDRIHMQSTAATSNDKL